MNEEKTETCGKRIEKALSIRQMKPMELCRLANIPKSSMSLYLQGAYEPKQDRIYKMAAVLNINEAWLMGYDVPMKRGNTAQSNSITLSDKEKLMLDLFRQVPEGQQNLLMDMIRVGLDTLK